MAVLPREPTGDATVPTSGTVAFQFATNDTGEFGRTNSIRVEVVFGGSSASAADITSDCQVHDFVELAAADLNDPVQTSVTGAPVFTADSGPADEDAWVVPVTTSTHFNVGDYLRVRGVYRSRVFKVLAKPSMSSVQILGGSDAVDFTDGDEIERVIPSGVYEAVVDVPTSALLDIARPRGFIRVEAQVYEGSAGTGFAAATSVAWTRSLNIDQGSVDVQVR